MFYRISIISSACTYHKAEAQSGNCSRMYTTALAQLDRHPSFVTFLKQYTVTVPVAALDPARFHPSPYCCAEGRAWQGFCKGLGEVSCRFAQAQASLQEKTVKSWQVSISWRPIF